MPKVLVYSHNCNRVLDQFETGECSVTNRYFQLSAALYTFLIEPTLNEFGLYAFLKIAIFSDYIYNSYKYSSLFEKRLG